MKKTLSINIAGFVFHIEEDAYELRRLADAFMYDNALTEIAYRETTLFQFNSPCIDSPR